MDRWPPNGLPESFREEAREAGFGLARYRSAVPGVEGPPHVVPRADEAWCLDAGGSPPESVAGMVTVPFDQEDCSGGPSHEPEAQ